MDHVGLEDSPESVAGTECCRQNPFLFQLCWFPNSIQGSSHDLETYGLNHLLPYKPIHSLCLSSEALLWWFLHSETRWVVIKQPSLSWHQDSWNSLPREISPSFYWNYPPQSDFGSLKLHDNTE